MRKTFYALTFLSVVATLFLNILSAYRPDWLVVQTPEIFLTTITVRYGLMERCERDVIRVPGPSSGNITYTNYSCRPFPARVEDRCEKENRTFCTAWFSATYSTYLGIAFAAMALAALLIGISTRSRRRKIWRAVAALVFFHSLFQIVTFAIITDLYRTSKYPPFEDAHFGLGYILSTVSWIAGLLIALGVIITGISADNGKKWAAGNRAYTPIQG